MPPADRPPVGRCPARAPTAARHPATHAGWPGAAPAARRPRRRGGRAARAGPARAGRRDRWRSSRIGDLGQRRLRGLPTRLRDGAHRARLLAEAPVRLEGVDRRELAPRRGDRALEVRALRVDHAVELAAQASGPRSGPRAPAARRCRRSGRGTPAIDSVALPGDHARGPRRTRHDGRQPQRRRGGPRGPVPPPPGPRTPGARGRRPGSASHGRGTGRGARRPGSAPGPCAQSRSASGRRNARRAAPPPSRAWPPRRTTRRATAGSRAWTRDPSPAISARRSQARAGSTAASSARRAATRSRSVPDMRPV